MEVNTEYLRGLLLAFEAAEGSTTDISELKDRGFDFNEKEFLFHMRLLNDQNFIECYCNTELGYSRSVDGSGSWAVAPMRLTAAGHEFVAALANEEVWSKVKDGLKNESMSTLWNISKQLLEGYAKKKAESLLGQ